MTKTPLEKYKLTLADSEKFGIRPPRLIVALYQTVLYPIMTEPFFCFNRFKKILKHLAMGAAVAVVILILDGNRFYASDIAENLKIIAIISGVINVTLYVVALWGSIIIVGGYSRWLASKIRRLKWEEERPAREEAARVELIALQARRAALEAERQSRLESEKERARLEEIARQERLKREQEEAFWASPEGQKVRAAEMIAEIRLTEQAEALKMAQQVADKEEARKEREFARLKEL
jgi:flagellar biosynthesis GTPase FlhF